MNPSHYIGTQPLAQELKSRARIIHDKYPPEELPDRSKNWEEALTIARHSVNLGSIRADEFIKGWAEKQQSLNGVWPPIMQQHASVLRSLESYIEFVNEMRRIYTETQTNQATNDEFHFPISLREGIQIMYEYDRAPGLGYKAAVLAVIEPKISGQDADMVEKEKKLLRDKVQAIIK